MRLIDVRYASLANPRGGRTRHAPPPPNGCGPIIFYAQNAIFSQIFLRSLRSRLILSIIIIEYDQKHAKNDFYFNFQHFQRFSNLKTSCFSTDC